MTDGRRNTGERSGKELWLGGTTSGSLAEEHGAKFVDRGANEWVLLHRPASREGGVRHWRRRAGDREFDSEWALSDPRKSGFKLGLAGPCGMDDLARARDGDYASTLMRKGELLDRGDENLRIQDWKAPTEP